MSKNRKQCRGTFNNFFANFKLTMISNKNLNIDSDGKNNSLPIGHFRFSNCAIGNQKLKRLK